MQTTSSPRGLLDYFLSGDDPMNDVPSPPPSAPVDSSQARAAATLSLAALRRYAASGKPLAGNPPGFQLAGGNLLQLVPVPPGPQAGAGNPGATAIPDTGAPFPPMRVQPNLPQPGLSQSDLAGIVANSMKLPTAAPSAQVPGAAGLGNVQPISGSALTSGTMPRQMQVPGGQLTLDQANRLFRDGGVDKVNVDASKYDFSHVKSNGFDSSGHQFYTFPMFKNGSLSPDYFVDGTVNLQMNPDGKSFHVTDDKYDFDMHPVPSLFDHPKDALWEAGRNVATLGGNFYADKFLGPEHPFDIVFQGNVPLAPKRQR